MPPKYCSPNLARYRLDALSQGADAPMLQFAHFDIKLAFKWVGERNEFLDVRPR